MSRIDFHFKVEADLEEGEDPRKYAAEICRQIAKIYGVRYAELSSMIEKPSE